jgi:DNA-binding LytR/AlgR family response regulator
MNATPTALIAEDEPLLALALQAELAQAWPELRVLAVVGDGASAVSEALRLVPDVLFFDIRMPGMSGLDAAAALADEWDTGAKPFPSLVFATAYDQYALQAFEAQAVDYLLKPVQPVRLARTVAKVQAALAQRVVASASLAQMELTLSQLRALLGAGGTVNAAAPLQLLQASSTTAAGTTIRMVPLSDVVYFEAADKYLRVLTARQEYLIRTPLKDLLAQLDGQCFWQIHRGTVVRASEIESVLRDESGKLSLSLRGRTEKLAVSRLYAHLFRAM